MFFNESSHVTYEISRDDPLFWSLPSPIDCSIVRPVGLLLCIAGFSGILLNGSLLASFVQYKILRTPPNVFIMFIAGVGLLAATTNLPMSGTSSVFCRWLYSRGGCQTEGLIAFLYGCSSCYLLCAVSLSRCYIIIRPFNAKAVTVSERLADETRHELHVRFRSRSVWSFRLWPWRSHSSGRSCPYSDGTNTRSRCVAIRLFNVVDGRASLSRALVQRAARICTIDG
jgi:hypothetical protein